MLISKISVLFFSGKLVSTLVSGPVSHLDVLSTAVFAHFEGAPRLNAQPGVGLLPHRGRAARGHPRGRRSRQGEPDGPVVDSGLKVGDVNGFL